jgi:membrane-bound ClpP family serine protease
MTISPALLILAALLALAWRFRAIALRAVYRLRAACLYRTITRDLRPPLLCLVGAVDADSAPRWCAAIRAAKPGPLRVLLHTYGGNSDARARVGRALAQHPGLIVAHVPDFAWSAGTALALACDRVMMGPDAVLGPIDPNKKADGGGTVYCAHEVAGHAAQTDPSVLDSRASLDECEAALRSNRAARRAFSHTPNRPAAFAVDDHLVAQLVRGGWGNHWRPIFLEDAQALGIDAHPEDPALHPRLAKLAHLTMLSLRECDR